MGRVGEVQWESVFGTTFPGYYAMFATPPHARVRHHPRAAARRWRSRTTTTARRTRTPCSEGDHAREGARPPSRWPRRFCVYDCCANADGAACVILAERGARARALRQDAGLARRRGLRHGQHVGAAPAQTWSACPRRARRRGQAYAHGRGRRRATSRSPRSTTASPSPRSWPTRTSASARRARAAASSPSSALVHRRRRWRSTSTAGSRPRAIPSARPASRWPTRSSRQLRGECGRAPGPGRRRRPHPQRGRHRPVQLRPRLQEGLSHVQLVRQGQLRALHQGRGLRACTSRTAA